MKRPRKSSVPNDPIVKLVREVPKKRISDSVLARSRAKPRPENAFVLPAYPKTVVPPGTSVTKHPLAMDAQIIEVNAWAANSLYAGAFNNGATFLGYPYLSQLAQIPEYRKITETIAMHMTRKFITLQVSGEASTEGEKDKTEKIKAINDELDKFKVRDVFRKLVEVDGYFGRAHLYIDLGAVDAAELKMPIGDGRNALSQMKVSEDSLKGFKVIEPVWTYPGNYNSNNPLTFDWYNPQTWFVMQREIHQSRCLRLVGREVPDLLKPAYSFGGLSLSQMAKPYVDNWLRTRQSVADLIWSFSVSGVMTDLQTTMQDDGQALFDRAELFNNLRNNRGMMLLNKDSEEFFQVNTPLGTLDKLQAQAQEHMASVSSIPLIFLLGITPSGLNASSEGEIRAFYDFIHAFQTKFFTDPLTRVIDFIQLNLYGQVDPEITFIFEPLWSMTEKEQAEVDKISAETDDLRINGGVVSPLEARKRVANSPDTPYAGLDVTELPVPPGSSDDDSDGQIEPGEEGEIGGRGLDPGKPEPPKNFGQDEAHFEESKHPRGQPGNAGQFGPGGGGGASSNAGVASSKQVKSILGSKAGISGKYRQGIQNLLKQPGLDAETRTKLKHKLVESLTAKAMQLKEKNDPKWQAVYQKSWKMAKSLGTSPIEQLTSVPIKDHPEILDTIQLTDNNGKTVNANGTLKYSDAEIAQAKKTTSLPNYQGLASVKAFNDKWAGKDISNYPHLIEEKIDEYKALKGKQAAEITEKQKADAEQAKEKAKKELEALTQELNDPQAAKHFKVLQSIGNGLSPLRKKELDAQIKKAGLAGTINAVDCALIQAYTSSDYGPVNAQMRAGTMTKTQYGYAAALQKALLKLPKFTGIVKRGTNLPAEVFAKYKPGYIVPERAFTSTGEGYKFSGTHTYTIESTSGRDVRHVSSQGPGEQEVIFPAGSHFEVISVEGKHIKLRQVEDLHD